MKMVYVLMARQSLPTHFCIPYPVEVFTTRKAANAAVKAKQSASKRLDYYLRTAKLDEPIA